MTVAQVIALPGRVQLSGLTSAEALAPGRRSREALRPWSWQALTGRLVELSTPGAGPVLTVALVLVRECQAQGEPVVWVTARHDSFYPPDAAAAGVALEALPVVRAIARQTAGRAAGHLLRSGAFGLVVLELPAGVLWPQPLLARLSRTAALHETALLVLTQKADDTPSQGSLVSLRAVATRERLAEGQWQIEVTALKDKRRAPGWRHQEVRGGPPGLC